jgi:hypothetical protein
MFHSPNKRNHKKQIFVRYRLQMYTQHVDKLSNRLDFPRKECNAICWKFFELVLIVRHILPSVGICNNFNESPHAAVQLGIPWCSGTLSVNDSMQY